MGSPLPLLLLVSALVLGAALAGPRPHPAAAPATPADMDDRLMHAARPLRRQRSLGASEEENGADFWLGAAQTRLRQTLQQKPNTNVAKNAILFLGDGMSVPTLAATRAYLGQRNGRPGEETQLFFETFPYSGMSKTYCVDSQVADSACSATAYLCGVKGNIATIGVTGAVKESDCAASTDAATHVTSLLRWAQEAGKATGIVTTTRVTHASPAGAYAHTANRDWEADVDVLEAQEDPARCPDIAQQLVTGSTGRNLKVILGGGRSEFRPKGFPDEEGQKSRRRDGVDLVDVWRRQKADLGARHQYVWDRDGLLAVDHDKNDYLLGLFEGSHMLYHLETVANQTESEPTLAEMVEAAISTVRSEKNGFVLFVEGGRIDHGHHGTQAKRALDETVQLAEAVQRAAELTAEDDTLLVVTADHAHTMSFSGYPDRGNDILGTAGTSSQDGLPYSTLSYANGPGYHPPEGEGGRHDLTNDAMDDDAYEFPALAPLSSETHGGDDVAVLARGPWAHLLTGVFEQNYIPHVMAYAACVGGGVTACDGAARRH